MRKFVNDRAASLQPSGIRKFFDIVQKMEGAVSLGVGEPDFITPWNIRDAAIRSVQRGYTQYTGNRGLAELRELISRYLAERFFVDYPADRIIITVGASEGIDLALRATCETGDEILIPDPAYVSYAPIIGLCGGKPVSVRCTITPKTKAVVLAYPNNPTGGVMTREQLEAIVPVIEKHDLLVISDEIYGELTYGMQHCSVASLGNLRERTVLLGGFSKAFAMTGWRVGFACAPELIDKAMLKIHQYTMLCAPRVSQHAAVRALAGGFESGFSSVEEMRAEYDRRRRYFVGALNAMGLDCFEPRGAFYVFPSVKSTGMTGEEFAGALLEEQHVAVVPGSAFGACGEYHVRCSYATGMRELSEAVKRMGLFLASRAESKTQSKAKMC